MFNPTTLKAAFITKYGWEQNPDPSGPQLDEMTSPTDGFFYNRVHPMLTPENIVSVATRFDQIHAGDDAARDAAFTAWVKSRTQQWIVKAFDDWVNAKHKTRTARNLLANNRLFMNAGSMANKELTTGQIVGLEVVPARSLGIIAKIRKIGVQFDTNQTITIKLFKSDTVAPVQSTDVVYVGNGGVQWETVDWELTGDGAYWVAYDQDAISGNAINGVYDYAFGQMGYLEFPTERYYGATAFNVTGTLASLWDISQKSHSVSTNYGLNLEMDVRCDYTQLFIDQADIFRDMVTTKVGMEMLREIAYNSNARINRNESNVRQSMVLDAIDGNVQITKNSLRKDYDAAILAASLDTTGIDDICLPCKKRSVNYTAIGPEPKSRWA